MNIITKRSHDGAERSCNAACYFSTNHTCKCICKRLMHGKGEAYAKLLAPKAAMYLQLQSHDGSQFFVAPELITDMQGR